jgi:ABC-2 type transport system permease protein
MFEQIATIARNTFIESIRQPIFVVLLVIGLMALTINPALSSYTLDDDNKLLIDLGLSTIFMLGLFLAAFSATGVLAREIENKTVLTVISKPIGRPAFIVGKYLGVGASIGVAFWTWSIVFLMTIRHKVMSTASDTVDMPVVLLGLGAIVIAVAVATWGNYFYGWVFSSRFSGILAVTITIAYVLVLAISKDWAFQGLGAEFAKEESQLGQVFVALLLVMEALAVICAVAIACSTRLGQVMTLMICLSVLFLGLISDYLFGRFTGQVPLLWGAYASLFNVQFFFIADALTQKHPVSAHYVQLVSIYTGLYIMAVLSLAVAMFQTRETG